MAGVYGFSVFTTDPIDCYIRFEQQWDPMQLLHHQTPNIIQFYGSMFVHKVTMWTTYKNTKHR